MIRFERYNPLPRRLHGTLSATVYQVDRLKLHGGLFYCLSGKQCIDKVKSVLCGSENAGSRLYVRIDLDKAKVAETRVIAHKHSNLNWEQSFQIYCAHTISDVVFTIKQDMPVREKKIGRAKIPVEDIIKGYIVERWLVLLDDEGEPLPGRPKLHVKLVFYGVDLDADWHPERLEEIIPDVYFNQREGCKVTLYQDVHVPDNFSPKIRLATKQYDSHRRCWEDIFEAISKAKHLIYITGWSVNTEITLVRDPSRPMSGSDYTVGKLLKKKADEGVTVLMLVWDVSKFYEKFKLDRLTGTHAQETYEYFKNTKVQCVLCPRFYPESEKHKIQGLEIPAIFTHHQKSVVVDYEIPGEASQKRRIVSFIGGIDLCDGRYDTPEHPLFKTLATVHQNDFHQPNFPGASIKKGGPREPWHDIHCRLEGPVAWDVLYNFEQRWKKRKGNDYLIPQSYLDMFLVHPLTALPSNDTETWNVQLFRSIDGSEAFGFPDKPEGADAVGLISMKDSIIDRSIQDAYINAIRRAKNFIYIENQYFCGSSFAWKSEGITVSSVNALHLIPRELSLKIVSKIEAGERFVVYVVIPMWPEGIPESDSIQEMLDWQRRTMQMMYSDIAEALKKKELKTDPREYLTFFCLGNRETKEIEEIAPIDPPEGDSDYGRAQRSRRFMIYVHSKIMIVDDDYIIVGSANLNQRSMDGARDTEIAMGAFQPNHLATKQPPKGQIHGFRLALWYEHLEMLPEYFDHPEREQCVHRVNRIADYNWQAYAGDSFDKKLQGHLLRYPIEIGNNGAVTTMTGTEYFPDTEAPILGKREHIIPDIATT